MASGNTLCVFAPHQNEPPASAYAQEDIRNGHPCIDFDAAVDESAIFTGILLRNYAGGGLTVYIHWSASSDTNTAHKVRWDVAFETISGLDIDADSFASPQSVSSSPNATSGIETVASVAFTDGAQIDSLAAGGLFRLKITRDQDHADDDLTGDAELLGIEIKET